MTQPSGRPLIAVKEAAERTGLDRQMIYRLIQAGEIPHRRIGRRVFVSSEWPDEVLTLDGGDAA